MLEAARIVRLAFGTFIGAPDPETFWADRDYVYGRQRAAHVASFGATLDGKLIGSNFATNWGSVGFFGPLTIRPDLWDRGVGKRLMEPIMECFANWGTEQQASLPLPIARSTLVSTRGLAFGRGFSPRSCLSRL